MTKEDLAKLLNGREIGNEVTESEERQAKKDGLVIVHGASDDLMEFRGAIYDEYGCYEGGTALVDAKGLLPERDNIDDDDELEEYFKRKKTARKIEAVWGWEKFGGGKIDWTYKTDIPHSTFNVMEDGNTYCRGIVFELSELGKEASKAPKRDRDKSKRPSPSDSATLYDAGFEKEGNDGNMYVIAVASNGIHRWVKKK